MNKLNHILNRINKTSTGIPQLEKKLKGLYLGERVYIIEEYLFDVRYYFSSFEKDGNAWKSNIDIEITNSEFNQKKLKKAIFDGELKKLMNERIFQILIQITDISKIFNSINSI